MENAKQTEENVEIKETLQTKETAQEKELTKAERLMRSSIFRMAFALFCALSAVIVFFFLLFRISSLSGFAGKVISSLSAVVVGFIIAYVLNPVMKFIERRMLRLFGKKKELSYKNRRRIRFSSIAVSEIFMVVIVVLLLMMLVPELIRNLVTAINQVAAQLEQLPDWLESLQNAERPYNQYVEQTFQEAINGLTGWMTGDLIGKLNVAGQYLVRSAISAVNFIFNFVIGIIVSMYILAEKEHFSGSAKKILYALMKPAHANEVLDIVRHTDHIFGGFIMGKIVDSAIIGVICYISLLILRMPYALVVSVIVGVTNIIPFFGPFIGAIPSAILIFLSDPIKGLIFVAFVLVLQQVDGNIIGPKILGESTGLSSFWIIFAILFSGGMFGVPGMVIGAPAFAVFYYLVKKAVDRRLRRKSMPTSSEEYILLNKVKPETGEMIYEEAD